MKNLPNKFYTYAAKHYLYLVLGSIALFILFIFFRMFSNKNEPSPAIELTLPKLIQEKLDKANEEYLIEKTKAKLEAEIATKQLEEVTKIDDGAERRKKLAELLN